MVTYDFKSETASQSLLALVTKHGRIAFDPVLSVLALDTVYGWTGM